MSTTTESNGSHTRTEAKPGTVFDAIDRRAVDAMSETPVVGLALGVVREGELAHELYHGFADVKTGRAIGQDTVFRIGSISKTFTAIAVMQLVEAGQVDLDLPANRYLKSIRLQGPAGGGDITVRHLLTHRSGIGELRSFRDLLGGVQTLMSLGGPVGSELPDLNDYYADGIRTVVPPEDRFAYANHAFGLLGQLVTDVSGIPFPLYQRERIFDPLGMAGTDYLRSERVRDQLAIGYAVKRGRVKAVRDLEVIPSGAGSIFSSVRDMSRYIQWLCDPDLQARSGVLRPETLRLMREPQYEIVPGGPTLGLAFILEQLGEHAVIGHSGGWPGFISNLLVAPEARTGVIVFTNSSAVLPMQLGPSALRVMLQVPEPVESLESRRVPPRPEIWQDLVGVYAPDRGLNTNLRIWMGFGGEVEVLVKGGHLTLRSLLGPLRKGARLVPVDRADPLLFEVEVEKATSRVRFRKDSAGRITHLAGPGLQVLRKRGALRSGRTWGRAALGLAAGGVALTVLRRRYRRTG